MPSKAYCMYAAVRTLLMQLIQDIVLLSLIQRIILSIGLVHFSPNLIKNSFSSIFSSSNVHFSLDF